MRRHIALQYTILYCTDIPHCNTLDCTALAYRTAIHCTVIHCTVLHRDTTLQYSVLYCTGTPHCIALAYRTALHHTALAHRTVLNWHTALHCTALHWHTALYCLDIPHCTNNHVLAYCTALTYPTLHCIYALYTVHCTIQCRLLHTVMYNVQRTQCTIHCIVEVRLCTVSWTLHGLYVEHHTLDCTVHYNEMQCLGNGQFIIVTFD